MSGFSEEILDEINKLVFDENDDGLLDKIVQVDRNDLGQISKVILDFEGDNIPDIAVYFEYDSLGRVITKSLDTNLDNSINKIIKYQYDDNGNYTIFYDDNADGKTDFIEKTDDQGNVRIHDVRSKTQKFSEIIKDFVSELKSLKRK